MGIALVIVGVANGATTALAVPFLTELLPKRRMGELIGLGGMMWSFAQPLGSTFAGFVADQTGTLRTLFVLTAVYLGLSCLITLSIRAPRRGEQIDAA
jgi:MFS family permease